MTQFDMRLPGFGVVHSGVCQGDEHLCQSWMDTTSSCMGKRTQASKREHMTRRLAARSAFVEELGRLRTAQLWIESWNVYFRVENRLDT